MIPNALPVQLPLAKFNGALYIYIARIFILSLRLLMWNMVAVVVLPYPDRNDPIYIYFLMNDYGISFVSSVSCCWACMYIRHQKRFHYIIERREYTRR
jgi:hypothetical protein